MANKACTCLDQAFAQAGKRPCLDHLRRRQRAQEVGEIVGQRMKLKPHLVGVELHARQARPFDRVFALFDMLLGCATLIVEGQHPLIGQAAIGHNKADTGEQLTRMELDLGDNPARLRPALRPVVEAGVVPDDMVRRASRAALCQSIDLSMQL